MASAAELAACQPQRQTRSAGCTSKCRGAAAAAIQRATRKAAARAAQLAHRGATLRDGVAAAAELAAHTRVLYRTPDTPGSYSPPSPCDNRMGRNTAPPRAERLAHATKGRVPARAEVGSHQWEHATPTQACGVIPTMNDLCPATTHRHHGSVRGGSWRERLGRCPPPKHPVSPDPPLTP